jgi:N-acyl-D-amino-acid deacylase
MHAINRQPQSEYDLVIINGRVIDVVGEKITLQNIGVKDGIIAKLTDGPMNGKRVIDAKGLLISPGFIDFHSHIDGNEFSAICMAMQGGTTTLGGERELRSKNISRVEEGFVINQGFFISQSFVLRHAVGIMDTKTPATRDEIQAMVELARTFLENGAFGISFALELVPGTSFDELLAMAKVAKEFERPIIVHIRKDGEEGLQYFEEIISVAKLTGVSVQILQLMYMVGIGGVMETALEIIEDARAQGLDIMADSGVYNAYTACVGTGIFEPGWEKEYRNTSIEDLVISSGIHVGEHCTKELFNIMRTDFPQTLVSVFVCDEEAIPVALVKDYVFVSTNAAEGPHYPGVGAPEVSGTFPRLLGRYVREEKVLSLMEAIKKITIYPATRFGLKGIGYVGEGANADLVIFDEKTIMDQSDFVNRGDPNKPPEGIEYVLVNGQIVVEHGKLNKNKRPGRFIRCGLTSI